MRSLRYWLGLPLYDLLLWLGYVLFCYSDVLGLGADRADGLMALLGLSMFVLPLLTALYYPVRREDCRPLHKTVLISAAAIFGVSFVTFIALDIPNVYLESIAIDAVWSLMLTFIQIGSYSLGLGIACGVSQLIGRAGRSAAERGRME